MLIVIRAVGEPNRGPAQEFEFLLSDGRDAPAVLGSYDAMESLRSLDSLPLRH
jgi:hypothetical protein